MYGTMSNLTTMRKGRRYALLTLAFLGSLDLSAEAKEMHGLLHHSSNSNHKINNLPGRRLEDAYAETFEYNDLSQYSVRFEKCQFVKSYDDEMAQDEDSDSPLATKHFVVYRLCPSDACETCDEKYGSYVVEVDTYLQYTINYQQQAFEDMCDNCSEKCNDDGSYCSGCGKICYNYANMENNGYVDASQYMECQQLDYGDDDGEQLYIGPMCSSSGQKITIGLFSDENCWEAYSGDLDVETVVGSKLSYLLISHASTDDGSVCLSCQENNDDENANQNDQADYDDVNEMCEDLYSAAAKCESKTGLEGGFIQTNQEDGDYENQVENEFMACTFIDSLIWNSYTETGEIDIDHDQDEIIRKTSSVQALTLSLLSLSIVSLIGTIAYIHHRINTQFPDIDEGILCRNPAGTLT